jgi:hypothetical protein
MADISDVEVALVNEAGAAIYPNGINQPPIGGYPCRITRGDVNAEALNTDLATGTVNITIRAMDKMARNTTRYFNTWQASATQGTPPFAVQMTGTVATFSGVGGAGAIAGARVRGQAFVYATVAGDTPASVAAALAAQIAGASASGAVLTLPSDGGTPVVVVYDNAQVITELRRQEQGFAVTVSANTPDARSIVAAALDTVFAGIDFLTLADGSGGRLRYHSTSIDDVPSRASLWKRTLIYTVEFGTTLTESVPEMVFGTLSLNGPEAGVVTATN